MRKSFKPKDINFQNLWDDMLQQHSISLKYFQNRHFQHLEIGYLHTLHRIEYDRKCYSSNPYAHFKKLIKERGFEDIDLYKNTNSASFQSDKKDLKEKTLQQKINSFDIGDKEYDKINELLKLDKNNADEFKLYFIDDNLLHRHWNLSTMFFSKDIDIKFDDFDCFTNNFTFNNIVKEKSKLKFLQDMKIECGCLDPYNITPKKIFDKRFLEDYKIIFRNRSKILKADTLYDCQKILIGMYKNLFGNIITTSRIKNNGKRIYHYSINNESLIQDKKLFEIRRNISYKVNFVRDLEKK